MQGSYYNPTDFTIYFYNSFHGFYWIWKILHSSILIEIPSQSYAPACGPCTNCDIVHSCHKWYHPNNLPCRYYTDYQS